MLHTFAIINNHPSALEPWLSRPDTCSMALPPGFLDDLKARLSLAQVVGRKVTWDTRKSNAGKGDYWSPCPFHQEKTASFHVDDRKGFYYCFGCNEKGDAVKFVRETENMGFMEAVQLLAAEAGMPVPQQDPMAQKREEKRAGLVDVMEMAVKFYRFQLNTSAAGAARDYIAGRGLSPETQERFEIGFAPNGRTMLAQHLAGKGIAPEMMVEAGLVIKPDDGGAPFDRFRDRIMFPIRDARGRAIAFGGRAMSPEARAKYLNSPETPLFDKGRTLFNHGPAREAAGKARGLIVAEGYMDVIALVAHGFGHAVAPLGTAITEDQLRLMWRIADEPVVALDGDKAGLRAAMRLIDVALPLLEAGKSLRFVILPDGADPDDLLRTSGPQAMEKLLAGAAPMIDLLWERETEGRVLDSPERRAGLDTDLRAVLGKITDLDIRRHYGAAIKERRAKLFAPPARSGSGQRQGFGQFTRGAWSGKRGAPAGPPRSSIPVAQRSTLGRAGGDRSAEQQLLECNILALCLVHPGLISQIETELEAMPFGTPTHVLLRDAILQAVHDADGPALDAETFAVLLDARIDRSLRDHIQALAKTRIAPHMRADADQTRPLRAIRADIARHRAILGHLDEVSDAMREMTGAADEGVTWRLAQAAQAQVAAERSALEGDEGDEEERAAMSQHLQDLIDAESWKKSKS